MEITYSSSMETALLKEKPRLGAKFSSPPKSARERAVERWFLRENVPSTTTTASDKVFPGQYYDEETNLHYNWHRYYDPSIGRYITSDPIGVLGQALIHNEFMKIGPNNGKLPSLNLNLYGYADQNPVMRIDPYGLDAFSITGQGSFHFGDAGGSASASVGVDGQGKVCFQTTVCGRIGAGASAGLSCGIKHSTDDFKEGDSASGGGFANVGAGPFGSVSVTTDGDNVTTTGTIGGGAGIAGGAQACITRTFCVSASM